MDDLTVSDGLTIKGSELTEVFATSGGPGGQHANRAASRVTLAWNVSVSGIDPDLRRRLERRLAARMVSGELRVTVDESRSQWRNRQLARRRLADMVGEALRPEPPRRRPTRPSRSKRAKRVQNKRRHGETKRLRGRPTGDD